jgi:hypothetical protein
MKHRLFQLILSVIFILGTCRAEDRLKSTNGVALAVADKTSHLSFGGDRIDFKVKGTHGAFVILPKGGVTFAEGKRPWVWYAPTFIQNGLPGRELDWLFPQLLQSGFVIAGVDVGESYGNPAGREVFDEFHSQIVKKFSLSSKACLLPQSRGGLMLYNWATEHPEKVQCIGGIYTVCNLASYPGLDKAAPAYGMTRDELSANLKLHNPIDRLASLAKAAVPIFHIHGDSDKIVPLEANSGELIQRYTALGGPGQLITIHGKGHEVCPEFFQSSALLSFFLSHSGTVTGSK